MKFEEHMLINIGVGNLNNNYIHMFVMSTIM